MPQKPVLPPGPARQRRFRELDLERTALANERTMLAYVRTMLAFFIVGGTMIKFLDSRALTILGWIMILIGLVPLVIGAFRYKKVHALIRELQDAPEPLAREPAPPKSTDE